MSITCFAGGSGTGTGTGSGTGGGSLYNNPSAQSGIKAYVDKNGDSKITDTEIMFSIEEFFDQKSPYSLEEIQGLIDSFFDN